MDLRIVPVTPERWDDLEQLFGPNGAFSNCWCTWYWLTGREFQQRLPAERRALLHQRVVAGPPPGILGYLDNEPVAWCALGPRSFYPRLARSRQRAAIDQKPVWSLVCLYIARAYRGRGLLRPLLRGALAYAQAAGAPAVEAYPIDQEGHLPPPQLCLGLARVLRELGFVEVARQSPTRPVMRYTFVE